MFWIPKGAKPAGILGSLKSPSISCFVAARKPAEPLGAKTSIVPALKLVAKRKTPWTLTPVARPLYTAPLPELSTAMNARLVSDCVPAQAESVPSSVSKMKLAGMFVPGTRNPVVGLVVGFQTMPVGAAGVGGGGWAWVDAGLQAVLGTELSGRGIATWSGTFTPAPS